MKIAFAKKSITVKKCPICKKNTLRRKFVYKKPPKKEINFGISKKNYYREYLKCRSCGHFFSTVKNFNPDTFYKGHYNESIYMKNFSNTFVKIINLPKKKSDNFHRVERIKNFCKNFYKNYKRISVLDIGSGLGVFPYAIKKLGLKINCIDPDKKSVHHLNSVLKIKSYCGNFLEIKNKKKYHLITFNKVLEHVKDPFLLLKHAKKFLRKDSLIYIELPDGEMASISKKGKYSEEFFIDHIHVFSSDSLSILIKNTGLKSLHMSRYIEPSGKITISAFCKN
jgi:SAM-dependent methyltransferase